MILVRLVYCSLATDQYDLHLDEILAQARKNNAKDHLTGALWCDGKHFLQILEGERQKVNTTYRRIVQDNRHSDVSLICFSEISKRLYADWSLAFYADIQSNRKQIIKYSVDDSFDPSRMTAESVLRMLSEMELSAYQSR